jgi:hypothetical protein
MARNGSADCAAKQGFLGPVLLTQRSAQLPDFVGRAVDTNSLANSLKPALT